MHIFLIFFPLSIVRLRRTTRLLIYLIHLSKLNFFLRRLLFSINFWFDNLILFSIGRNFFFEHFNIIFNILNGFWRCVRRLLMVGIWFLFFSFLDILLKFIFLWCLLLIDWLMMVIVIRFWIRTLFSFLFRFCLNSFLFIYFKKVLRLFVF